MGDFKVGDIVEVSIHGDSTILRGEYIGEDNKTISLKIVYDKDRIFEVGRIMSFDKVWNFYKIDNNG